MSPGLNVNISAGTIASMTPEQFAALQSICAEGSWDHLTEPIHVNGAGDYIGVWVGGLFLGIEKDGYTHS